MRPLAAMSWKLCAVIVLPLAALAMFETYWYVTRQWPFGFGSTVPDLIAEALSLGGLFLVLATSSVRLRWKLVGACVAPLVYLALRGISGLSVACANGNCL
jgi:hypothetical protein